MELPELIIRYLIFQKNKQKTKINKKKKVRDKQQFGERKKGKKKEKAYYSSDLALFFNRHNNFVKNRYVGGVVQVHVPVQPIHDVRELGDEGFVVVLFEFLHFHSDLHRV
jgi:hypothetical protein